MDDNRRTSAASVLSVASSRLGANTLARSGKTKSQVLLERLQAMEKYMLSHDFAQEAKAKIEEAQHEEEHQECLTLLSSMSNKQSEFHSSTVKFTEDGDDDVHARGGTASPTQSPGRAASSSASKRPKSPSSQARGVGRESLRMSTIQIGRGTPDRGRFQSKQHLRDTVDGRWIYRNEHTKNVLSKSGAAVQHALQALSVLTESNVDLEEEERALQRQLDELRTANERQKAEMHRLAASIKTAQELTSADEKQVLFSAPSLTAARRKKKQKPPSHGPTSLLSRPLGSTDAGEGSTWRGGRWRDPPLPSLRPYSGKDRVPPP